MHWSDTSGISALQNPQRLIPFTSFLWTRTLDPAAMLPQRRRIFPYILESGSTWRVWLSANTIRTRSSESCCNAVPANFVSYDAKSPSSLDSLASEAEPPPRASPAPLASAGLLPPECVGLALPLSMDCFKNTDVRCASQKAKVFSMSSLCPLSKGWKPETPRLKQDTSINHHPIGLGCSSMNGGILQGWVGCNTRLNNKLTNQSGRSNPLSLANLASAKTVELEPGLHGDPPGYSVP
mmetsp:Transcript_2583/g.3959  ORF Transcript_2583/g.3959 Transcript_2583/m.3959 type:complete len:238 (+) Transcript_2583:109-822(+)